MRCRAIFLVLSLLFVVCLCRASHCLVAGAADLGGGAHFMSGRYHVLGLARRLEAIKCESNEFMTVEEKKINLFYTHQVTYMICKSVSAQRSLADPTLT